MARWNQWPEESSLLPNSRIGGAAECHRKYFSGSPSRVVREIIFLSVNVLLAGSAQKVSGSSLREADK